MNTWQTIQTILLFLGPWLLPRLFSLYRTYKNRPASQIVPLPPKTQRALTILFASSTLALLSTLPLFSQDNIFRQTSSRLGTPANVLLTRLAAIRPLKPEDEVLRTVFDQGGLEARLFYTLFGPSVTLHNPLSNPGEVDSFRWHLIYALPSLLTPHLLHILALGGATSALLSGHVAAKWRVQALIAALALAAVEIYYISTYDFRFNAASTRVNDVDFAFWKVRVYRSLAMAGTDAGLGWMMWMQGTGRLFLGAKGDVGERLREGVGKLEGVLAKTRGLGVVRNGTVREARLRGKVEDYWVKEGEVMRDLGEEKEVLEAERGALQRLDMAKVARDAESFVDSFLGMAPTAASVEVTS